MLKVQLHPYIIIPAAIIIFLIPGLITAGSDDAAAYRMITYYFDLIQSGNYESACGMWEPSALKRSERLGIEYEGINVKADCNSPIIYNTDQLKEFLFRGIKSKIVIDSGVVKLKFSTQTGREHVEYYYYTKKLGRDFWLIFPHDYYTEDWPVIESNYFRFHISPGQEDKYNEVASGALDDFVKQVAKKISISGKRLNLLAGEKIDYYLCRDEAEVHMLSDQESNSVYDMGSDAVFSSVFPDFHLTARLLINFKLKNIPPFTLPLMNEGLAIYLGGNWKRSPGVIIDFGEYIIKYIPTEVDSVLVWIDPIEKTLADITYPIDACLIDFMYNTLGNEDFFKLYRKLSGGLSLIEKLTVDNVKAIISGVFNQRWDEFVIDFKRYTSIRSADGGLIYPGTMETGEDLLKDSGLSISASEKWLAVKYRIDEGVSPEINVLFNKMISLDNKASSLFSEQYKDEEEYEGYRFGIMLDKNEIGLYDYAINQLKAKYVYNFNPHPDYFNKDKNEVTAYFDIELLGETPPDFSAYKILK